MPARPPIRLLAPLWLGLIGVAAATGALMVDAGSAALRLRAETIREERFRHSAQTLRLGVEGALALGLPLEQLPRVQSMLEAERAAAPGTLSIEVFDRHGRVLFGTDRSFVGDLVSETLLARAGSAGIALWRAREDDTQVTGAPVVNGFGTVVGQVAVRYPAISASDLPPVPPVAPLAILAAFAAVLGWALSRIHRPLGRDLQGARQALSGSIPPAEASALVVLAAQARQRVETRLAALQRARTEIQRLDDNA